MIVMALVMAQASPDTAAMVKGEKVFQQNCAIGYCHGTGGAASRGSRLRDRSFTRAYLEKVVREGLPQTAMPGFSGRLSDSDLMAAIDYVASLSTVSGHVQRIYEKLRVHTVNAAVAKALREGLV